jgi:hypothetical protein
VVSDELLEENGHGGHLLRVCVCVCV